MRLASMPMMLLLVILVSSLSFRSFSVPLTSRDGHYWRSNFDQSMYIAPMLDHTDHQPIHIMQCVNKSIDWVIFRILNVTRLNPFWVINMP